MSRARHESSEQRRLRFEQFEQRLVMSAQAVGALLPELEIASPALTQQVVTHPLLNNAATPDQAADIGAKYGFDGSGQTVAVIDSGIAWDHYALGGGFGEGHKVVGGWDFAENDANPYDDGPAGFHGTHVAGIIGSEDQNYQGVSSGVDLVALRVFDDAGAGDLAWVEQALQWVHEHKNDFANPITTVNLSLGTDWNGFDVPEWASLEDEFAQLETDGLFISVAAGNDFRSYGTAGLSYPAISEHVVPVASHDAQGMMSEFSQRASHALVAPGESIRSTVPDHLFGGTSTGQFLGSTGTSMSAPYVAGASAILRQANQAMGVTEISQNLLYQQFMETADQIYDSVTQGYYYKINLEAAIAAVLDGAAADQSADVTPIEWGQIVSSTIPGQEIAGEAMYQLTASRDGFVTIQAASKSALGSASLTLEVYDGQMNKLATQSGAELRLDLIANYGETLYVKAIGNTTVDFQVDNLVSLRSGRLTVNGTHRDDTITVDASNQLSVSVNGLEYQFDKSAIVDVRVMGHLGTDQISLQLGQESDTLSTTPTSLNLKNERFQLRGTGLETIQVDGGAGHNTVSMQDTAGSDHLAAFFDSTTLSGTGYSSSVANFDIVYVQSSGGHDSVEFRGDHLDDLLVSRNNRHTLHRTNAVIVADQFSEVQANGGAGNDRAILFDSQGNDQFVLSPDVATVNTGRFQLEASGFETVNAISTAGDDTVRMLDSLGDESFRFDQDVAIMDGAEFTLVAHGFTSIQAVASGGQDQAMIFDTAFNDVFTSDAQHTELASKFQTVVTDGFDRVNIKAQRGGFDQAIIIGSHGDDRVSATSNGMTLTDSQGQVRRTSGFDKTTIDLLGGTDQAFLQGSQSKDRLTANYNRVEFESTLQMLQLSNLEHTHFEGNGGVDEVLFNQMGSMDVLESLGDGATAYLNDHTVRVKEIAILEAQTVDEAIAEYDLDAADFLFMLRGQWNHRS